MPRKELCDLKETKKCPVCGGEYVALVRGYLSLGKDAYEISHDQKIVYSNEAEPSIRGSVLIREYFCESGHRWEEAEQFHKGNTYTGIRLLENVGPKDPIWRD